MFGNKSDRGSGKIRRSPAAEPSVDKLDLLTGAALVTLSGSVITLMSQAVHVSGSGAVLPAVSAGLVAGSLVLFRQWRKSVQLTRTSAARSQYLLNHDVVTQLPNLSGVVALLEEQRRRAVATNEDPTFGAIVCVGLTRLRKSMTTWATTVVTRFWSRSPNGCRVCSMTSTALRVWARTFSPSSSVP